MLLFTPLENTDRKIGSEYATILFHIIRLFPLQEREETEFFLNQIQNSIFSLIQKDKYFYLTDYFNTVGNRIKID